MLFTKIQEFTGDILFGISTKNCTIFFRTCVRQALEGHLHTN